MNNGKPKPFNFQKKAIIRIEDCEGRSLLAMEMGTGKTPTSLWCLNRNPDWYPALVICPSALKYNWEYEAQRFIGVRAAICEGQTPPRRGSVGFLSQSPITIINYDVLRFWVPHLLKMNFKTVIIDESQNLMNVKAKRTKAAQLIASKSPHLLALSGTPLLNRPVELYPILNMIWPREFTDWWSYVQRYCDPQLKYYGWDFSGSSNLPELREKLLNLGMVRYRKKDVLKDLPDKMRCIIPCKLSDPKEYTYASTNFMSWMRMNHREKVHKAKKAEAFVKIGYLLRLCTKLKLRSIVNETNEFLKNSNEKVVLFAIHTKAIDVLHRRIEYPNVVVDGSVTGRKRQVAIEQFQNDKRIRVLIGQHHAAGVGLNLTAASRVGIIEFGWRPGDLVQLEDRIHRIGQTRKSIVHYYPAIGTIEEKICRILQEKQDVLNAVLDGERAPEDLNIYDLLLEELRQS